MVNIYGIVRLCMVLVLLMVNIRTGFAALVTSVNNGSWSDTSTWVNQEIPKAGDDVVISHDVTLDQVTQVIGSLQIAAGGKLLAGPGTWQVRLSGVLANDGILSLYSGPAAYVDVVLSGDSYWLGKGNWTLAGTELIFLSGQVGLKPDGSLPPSLAEQSRQVFANIGAILQAAGSAADPSYTQAGERG